MSDVYDQLADEEVAQRAAVAGATMRSVVGTNPDQQARALQASRETGMPLPVVERNLDTIEQQRQQRELDSLILRSPILARQLSNPGFAGVAKDDLDSLSGIERAIGSIRTMRGPQASLSSVAEGIFKSFGQGLDLAREGVRMQAADLFGFKAMGSDAKRRFEQARFEGDATSPDFESSTARGLYGGAVSTVRAVPSVAASIFFRNPAIGLGAMGLQTEAEAYGKYRSRGASGGMAALGAIGEGAVEVATELLPMGFLVGKFGKVGAKEFLAGMLLREMPTEQVATFLQDAIDTAVANPEKTWGQFAAERPEAAYQTALAVLVQSSVFGAANSVAKRMAGPQAQAQQAEEHGAALERLAKFGAASKVMARDAQTVREFVGQVAGEDGDAPTEFFIDGAQLVNTLNQSGMSREEIEAVMPVAAAQIADGEAGSLVRLPVSEFMGLGDKAVPMIDHIRTAEDMPSRAESREFMTGQGKELQADVERELTKRTDADAFRESIVTVQDHYTQALVAAGQTADVAKANAALTANWYGTMAARSGSTLEEFGRKYKLDVVNLALQGGRTMSQVDVAGLTREQFLGDPTITKNSNASELKPSAIRSLDGIERAEKFMGGKYMAKFSPNGSAVFDGDKVVASYDFGDTLVVDRKYRRQGIGEELVYQWRKRYPAPAKATTRTKASQHIQEKVWDRLVTDKSVGQNILNQSAQRDMIELRKREAVLTRLLECL